MKYKIYIKIIFILIVFTISCSTAPAETGEFNSKTQTPKFILSTLTPSIQITSKKTTAKTPSPTRYKTQIKIPTETHIIPATTDEPIRTIEPTLSANERNDKLLELLLVNENCELPCFWGFTPGMTMWEDVYKFLSNMGNSTPFETIFQGNPFYSVEYQDSRDNLTIPVSFYLENDTINFIMSQILVRSDSPQLEKLESIYSVHAIMEKYGVPSRILTQLITGEGEYPSSTIFKLWIIYDQKGFAIEYNTKAERVGENYRSCPNKSLLNTNQSLQLELMTQSSKNERPIEAIYKLLGMKISGYQPIQNTTGLSVDKFYNLIINDGESACFSTPRSIWP